MCIHFITISPEIRPHLILIDPRIPFDCARKRSSTKYKGVQLLQALKERDLEAVRFEVNRILTGFRHVLDRTLHPIGRGFARLDGDR